MKQTCLQRLMKYLNYYYYSEEQQILKLECKDNVKYLVINHFTKDAFIHIPNKPTTHHPNPLPKEQQQSLL